MDHQYIENYYDITKIKNYFFDEVKDTYSGGPKSSKFSAYGMHGCWDIPLRLENKNNPIHDLIHKIQNDFGHFKIIPENASIRLMGYPFVVHDDLGSNYNLWNFLKSKGAKEYRTYLIPLSWEQPQEPGTAFFSSPPRLDEPLYKERLDILPHYNDKSQDEQAKYSIQAIYKWRNPGDLVTWINFQHHCTLDSHTYPYSANLDKIAKSFISLRTY